MSKVVRPFSFKGLYKKIGVCGGRSIYQHANNTDIFMYYGCGRWFIGLEIGVSGNRFSFGVPSYDLLPTRCVEDGCLPSLSPSVFTASMRLVCLCCSSTQKSPRAKILRWLSSDQVTWSMTSDQGLLEDRSLRVDQTCQEEYAPRFISSQQSFFVYHTQKSDFRWYLDCFQMFNKIA